ncbi:MAG: selenide, water dikinase SelD [Pseudomonadota bacterium]
MRPIPLTRDLVLVGGGHTHALVLRRWGMRPLAGARLTLINPGPTAPYTGMLPGFVAGHYRREELDIDLVRLARYAGARLILGTAEGIDRAAKTIDVTGRGPVRYDIASIDIGITSAMPDLPGFAEHAVAAKPLGAFADAWSAFVSEAKPAPSVAIVGGGIGGVELAMAMGHALRKAGRDPRISVVDSGNGLPGIAAGTRAALTRQLARQGCVLRTGCQITEVTAEGLVLRDGEVLQADFVTGAAGARPYPWLAETGLHTTGGFLDVGRDLRTSDPAIYAAGDCAHLTHAPRPKAGVFAVRAAPVLTHNLSADLAGGARRAFQPQRTYLKLVSLGDKAALADKGGLAIAHPVLWNWKDRIDRRFMARLAHLQPMAPPPPPRRAAKGVRAALAGPPPCAGCGAKVGPEALAAALGTPTLGDDAAVLEIGAADLVLTTDHLPSVTADPYLMGRIAATHALGDIWAMGARPEAALTHITLPPLAPEIEADWLREISAGAAYVFEPEGIRVIGGHTTTGAEFILGYTILGRLDAPAITLAGARPGDALILTRPLGSGTILAGDMGLAAKGADVAAALAQMANPQGPAASALAHAHAMTDVTGFGLAGHLANMVRTSNTGAILDLNQIPVLPGAEALAASGVRSSLYDANRSFVPDLVPESPRAHLLFDPQTAGGLLAAIAPEAVERSIAALGDAGVTAARIGEITARPGLALRT